MTRTGTVGQPFGNALDYGAGHVDPAKAMSPGLGKNFYIIALAITNTNTN